MTSTTYDRRGWVCAVLTCGNELHFRSAGVAPSVADIVPCARHGYCRVDHVLRLVAARQLGDRRRRGIPDVEAFMLGRPSATADDLRHARFSLRLIKEAHRLGLVREAVDDVRRVS